MERGEVGSVALPFAAGREQSGQRPAIVIQDNAYGQNSPLVLIVPFTSQLESQRFTATVRIEPSPENGLSLSSIAMVFQMRAVDRNRFVRQLGTITEDELDSILSELAHLTGQG